MFTKLAGKSGLFKTKLQVFQVKITQFPGVKLDINFKIPGEFYAGSQGGQALVYAL